MYEALAFAYIYGILVKLIFVLIGVAVIMRLFLGSKTYRYRKELVDMYVVGKIKKYAEKDKIDLVKELKEFRKSVRLRKDLDDSIEDKLSQQILEEKIKKEKEETKD